MRCVVFTKPPIPGTCKTRLIPALGPEGAAALHRAMAEDVLACAQNAGLSVELAVTGCADHPWFTQLSLPLSVQVEGDLGARMLAALTPGPAIALGTDSPTLPVEVLRSATQLQTDILLGPASDGGYWCIGWKTPQPALMREMPWSTDRVFPETVLRARQMGLGIQQLPTWYDVDTPAALAHLREHLRTLPPSVAPRTREFLHAAADRRPPRAP